MATCAGRGEPDGVEIEDGSIYIARTKPTVPDAARLMTGRLYGMLPRVRVTEVVEDVALATGFTACFTHLRTGNPAGDLPALFAALLADGTNLGLSRMADATRGLNYHRLVNMAQWHVDEDNYASGRAVIVEAHHRWLAGRGEEDGRAQENVVDGLSRELIDGTGLGIVPRPVEVVPMRRRPDPGGGRLAAD